jgi:glutaredoxin
MDAASRRLLEAFDNVTRRHDSGEAAGQPLGLESLSDTASDAAPGVSDWRALAEQLLARGWLRRGDVPDTYTRTEDGRLALAGPLDVTLYTRPGCHLCDSAKEQIAPLLRRAGAKLREVNIDEDADLRERYNVDVPVIFLGARKVAKHRVDLQQFQRQLEEARGG